MPDRIIHIVCGPTASGKSAKSLELASELNGVIINCDSMQLYDGLHTLTAQPSPEEQDEIPHRLYSALHPNDACSAGNYREMVEPVIEEVFEHGQTPIVVGGTGLYIKALMEGLSPIPDIPDDVRAKTIQTYDELGAEKFYAELQKRDPVMADRFHANHKARIMRAWEVLEATGKSLAEWQKLPASGPPTGCTFEVHKIMPERPVLRERCDKRFDWMMDNGVIEEVKTLISRIESGEVKDGVPLTNALGFHPLQDYLNGECELDEAVEKSKAETRQYAKRQTTWFRGQL